MADYSLDLFTTKNPFLGLSPQPYSTRGDRLARKIGLEDLQRRNQMGNLDLANAQDEYKKRQRVQEIWQQTGGNVEQAIPLIMSVDPVLGDKLRQNEMARQMTEREAAMQNYKLQEGMPAPEVQAGPQGSYTPPSEIPPNVAPPPQGEMASKPDMTVTGRVGAGVAPIQSPIPAGFTKELPMESVNIPGVGGVPGFTAKLQSQQDLFRKLKAQTEEEAAAKLRGSWVSVQSPYTGEMISGPKDLVEKQYAAHQKLLEYAQKPERNIDPLSPEGIAARKNIAQYEAGLKPQEDAAVSLTSAGLDAAALNFAKTGQLPPMGMGKQGAAVRAKIINRAAELNPELDVASNRAGFAANQESLKGLQKNRDAIVSFENTANKNLDLLLQAGKAVTDAKSPIINKPLRSINRAVLGSAELAAYDAARRVAVNEIAKVTSNPNLSGQLSDSARKEVENFIPENATLAQIISVANTLKQDMKNRHESLDAQIGEIQGRIKGGSGSGGGAGKRGVYNPATGKVEYK